MNEDHGETSVPDGGVTGGQVAVQAPVQVEPPFAERSASKTYTVREAVVAKPWLPPSVTVLSGVVCAAVVGAVVGVRHP